MTDRAAKTCRSCGRTIQWRKKWERDWDQVRYCSQRCRGRRITADDAALEAAILEMLSERQRGASICPSDAAKRIGGNDEAIWRPLMEPARAAARRLVADDLVVVTQRGRPVDASIARGPIRIRRA
ncbi:MAG: DUF2256 and DUF3253 domain-containing protein [Acidimicrobiales bacterium]|nr:DUF2256 and DUF3253 domain-containing protein [Acidimicrobiales bacterium]